MMFHEDLRLKVLNGCEILVKNKGFWQNSSCM